MNRLMKKMTLVHFMPLEYYPPITNLLKYIENNEAIRLNVLSSHNVKNRQAFESEDINIIRFPFPEISMSRVRKLFYYVRFNVGSLFRLIIQNPEILMYYESYSALPVYWYKKFIKPSVRLFIHNHEYFDKEWYEKGMITVRNYHKKEINFLYQRAEWISQTNSYRLDLFHQDHSNLNKSQLHVLANYPPANWANTSIKHSEADAVRFVYVGSLSLKTSYIKEMCDWVLEQNGKATFEIYAYNIDSDTQSYLTSIESEYINFHINGVEYYDIPKILADKDVGLILHKAHTINFKFNETNKLFEYLICHLNVWFSKELEALSRFKKLDKNQNVYEIDFLNLNDNTLNDIISVKQRNTSDEFEIYSFETEYKKLLECLL